MTREDYIKILIAESGHNLKSFAEAINLPYTTLLGMLNRGIGGAALDRVYAVCNGLSISLEDLLKVQNTEKSEIPFYVSEREKQIITRYREKNEMQSAVDVLLGLPVPETQSPYLTGDTAKQVLDRITAQEKEKPLSEENGPGKRHA